MTAPAYGRYDVSGYIAALRREGDLLAAAAERAGMGAAVPSCPGWVPASSPHSPARCRSPGDSA